jgi:multidrug efflux system membrane fusion protein
MLAAPGKRCSACRFVPVFILCILPFSCLWQGCANGTSVAERAPKKGPDGGAVPVTVSRATKKNVPIEIQAVGNVEASSTVAVKAQISGELTKVFFREGDFVKKGEELFSIDARTYEAQLNQVLANLAKDEAVLAQSESNLARDMAQLNYAQSEAARSASLYEKKLVSKEQNEQARASSDAALAAVQADRAAIQSARAALEATKAAVANARVMLSYTTIYSPIDGRTGNLDVDQGNVISPNINLMTINQIEPVFVSFAVPEARLRDIKKGQKVIVVPQNASVLPETGKLFFIDNAVDMGTGTIRLKASFPNRHHRLWPGEFVRVTLRLSTRPDTVVVPSQAVQNGQDGFYVFVVKADRTVESRPVVPGSRVDQDIVIEKGLNEGDIVVTEGQLRLAVGNRVQFSSAPH